MTNKPWYVRHAAVEAAKDPSTGAELPLTGGCPISAEEYRALQERYEAEEITSVRGVAHVGDWRVTPIED